MAADEVGTPPDYTADVSIQGLPKLITGPGTRLIRTTRPEGRIEQRES